MNKPFVAIASVCILAAVLALHLESRVAQDQAADRLEDVARVIQTREQLKLRGDRLIRLPEDGGAWHLTVWYDDKTTSPASRQLAGMIAGTPRLAALAAQTMVHEHQASKPDWVFNARYANLPRPGILLQDAVGNTYFKAAGNEIPIDGEALADAIANSVNNVSQCGPDGCPMPQPNVRPAPMPPDDSPDSPARRVTKPRIDRRPSTQPTDGETGALALAALALVAILIFVFKKGK